MVNNKLEEANLRKYMSTSLLTIIVTLLLFVIVNYYIQGFYSKLLCNSHLKTKDKQFLKKFIYEENIIINDVN